MLCESFSVLTTVDERKREEGRCLGAEGTEDFKNRSHIECFPFSLNWSELALCKERKAFIFILAVILEKSWSCLFTAA